MRPTRHFNNSFWLSRGLGEWQGEAGGQRPTDLTRKIFKNIGKIDDKMGPANPFIGAARLGTVVGYDADGPVLPAEAHRATWVC